MKMADREIGILIKDMKMPKSCPCELLGIGYDVYCSFACGIPARVKEFYECCQNDTRPSWCPLVPIPPHGDLIDRGALEQDAQKRLLMCNKNDNQFQKPYEIMRAIALAPTIIEAEEGE